jgi:hypothetical protein
MKFCRRVAGSAEYLSFHIQLHRPNNIMAAISSGALFVGTRVLEPCQKRN